MHGVASMAAAIAPGVRALVKPFPQNPCVAEEGIRAYWSVQHQAVKRLLGPALSGSAPH